MAHVNLLSALPKTKRNVTARKTAKTQEHIRIAKEFGEMYFDGPREYGYGGYTYDGRWRPVAQDIVDHFDLRPGSKVLDIGAAKGFLVKDLLELGIDAYGIDISEYALLNAEPEAIGRLHLGTADRLPFPDGSFDAVLAINILHNLERPRLKIALHEMTRLAGSKCFLQVDSYHTDQQRETFESWVLTAEFYGKPEVWVALFEEVGYQGDWDWTVIE